MDGPLLSFRLRNPRGRRAPSLESVPAPALVLAAIASVQMGSAVAARLFDRAGPAGVVWLGWHLARSS